MTGIGMIDKGIAPQYMGKPLSLLPIKKAVNLRTALKAILSPPNTLHKLTLSEVLYFRDKYGHRRMTQLDSMGQEGGSLEGSGLQSPSLRTLSSLKDEEGHSFTSAPSTHPPPTGGHLHQSPSRHLLPCQPLRINTIAHAQRGYP